MKEGIDTSLKFEHTSVVYKTGLFNSQNMKQPIKDSVSPTHL